jgi:hypothetical protein
MDTYEFTKAVDRTIEEDVRQLQLGDFGEKGDGSTAELGVEHNGEFTQDNFRETYEEFVRNPSMNGVGTEFKMAILFEAVQNEMEKDGNLNLRTCGACQGEVGSADFAEEFVEAYQKHVSDTKTDLARNTLSAVYNLLRRNWGSALLKIVGEIVPILERYMETDPRVLNEVQDFSYTIKDGVIYHNHCFDEMEDA